MATDIEKFAANVADSYAEPVAIIGVACVFPQAPDIAMFWRNILRGVDAIDMPGPAWDAQRYLDSGRIKTAYGGYLKDLYRFDPREFGVMPNSIDGGEPDQFLALRVARDALADAGYIRDDFDHRDTGIILGHSTYLHRGQGTLIQNHVVVDQTLELLRAACPYLDDDKLDQIRELVAKKLPSPTADIAPGLVPNVMTGRIANRLNLKGPNYLVDAACSSSLLAVGAAMDELRAGRSRLMLAGGVNASLPAEVNIIFTQLGALSQRGKVRPFESGSDGTLLGEGLGVVALKRLSDALEDGDRVYAVVRSIGQASDGRGHGLLAPSVDGEALAIQRAYASSGLEPASIGLIEAHGTGIPLGDQTEIAALKTVFGERQGTEATIALGSVKSMISHCIPAAGIAGLIKVALALHHKVLPPTLCENVNPNLGIESTPFYVNTQARPWISKSDTPRRAGVNSFGFGGINAHAIVEEAPSFARKPDDCSPWPAELLVFAGNSRQALADKLDLLATDVSKHPEWQLDEIAAAVISEDRGGSHRIALVAKESADLSKQINQARKRLLESDASRWSTRSGLFYSCERSEGKLAFLFPGEGSQYIGMFADLAVCFGVVREWFDFWRSLYDDPPGETRTDILFAPLEDSSAERRASLEQRLNDMDVGSEAVFIGGQAMHALLGAFGIEPDVMVGHSSGESSALAASGAIATAGRAQLADFIRKLNAVYRDVSAEGKIPKGALLTVGALERSIIDEQISASGGDAVVAMDNCANQVILYGSVESIEALQRSLIAAGGICVPLPFDRGYHTPAFAGVSEAFLDYYRDIGLEATQIPLYSCASTDLFPDSPDAVCELAAQQWSSTVRFRETLERMHDDGVRYFIEVGPSGNLTSFVNDVLAGREYTALATNLRRRNGVEQFLSVLASLYADGHPVCLEALFSSRSIEAIDRSISKPAAPLGLLLDNTIPMVRFDEADCDRLRELAAPPASIIQNDVPRETAVIEAPRAGERDSNEHVMAEYFDLMRTFLDQQGAVVAGWQGSHEDEEAARTPANDFAPFLDSVVIQGNGQLAAVCHLNLYQDDFLQHHILSGAVSDSDPQLFGLSCVPLTVSLEILAEACATLAQSAAVCAIENVKAYDWIALDEGELTLDVLACVEDATRGIYSASLFNGDAMVISANIHFSPDWQAGNLAPLTESRPSQWRDEELYATGMFHGPIFQSIQHIRGWDSTGMDADLSPVSLEGFFSPSETPRLILNPILLDAAGQLAAYWIAEQIGTDFNCFPSTIGRIELYEPCPADLPGVVLRARQQSAGPGDSDVSTTHSWQFEYVDQEGRPLARITDLVNVHFSVPNRFYCVRRDPLTGWLGGKLGEMPKSNILVWELPNLADDFCAQSGEIFLRMLAHVFLNSDERVEWQALAGPLTRRREWLLGRACIKEAVRCWIFERSGRLLHSADIDVCHDEAGAPYVDGWWRDTLVSAPMVSLSHDKRTCVAAVGAPEQPVGIDIEEIGRIQKPELIIETLTASERGIVSGLHDGVLQEMLLRLWCAKEAAAKLLGHGFQGRPGDFEVSFPNQHVDDAFVHHAEMRVEVVLRREQDSIIAVACGQQDSVVVH